MGAFKLGKMTFGSLFKKPETVKYPFETKPQPMGLKGHIEVDAPVCILCGMCDRSCATNCITVDKEAGTWSIDRLQCVQCGYCITVCPKKCLSMNPNYAPATTVHELDVVVIKEGEAAAPAVKAEPAAKAEPAPAPAAEKAVEEAAEVAEAAEPVAVDAQVAALIGLMDPAKAEKVKSALS